MEAESNNAGFRST